MAQESEILSEEEQIERDLTALAELLYDIYQEKKRKEQLDEIS